MIIESVLPPTTFQSVIDNQWYIVTTDPKLGWVKVDRKYDWSELSKMWKQKEFKKDTKVVPAVSIPKQKQTYKVDGSKGNKYTVINDKGIWTCTCPAHGFGRGKDCKHIKSIKNGIEGK